VNKEPKTESSFFERLVFEKPAKSSQVLAVAATSGARGTSNR